MSTTNPNIKEIIVSEAIYQYETKDGRIFNTEAEA
jgi:hypothetical protein